MPRLRVLAGVARDALRLRDQRVVVGSCAQRLAQDLEGHERPAEPALADRRELEAGGHERVGVGIRGRPAFGLVDLGERAPEPEVAGHPAQLGERRLVGQKLVGDAQARERLARIAEPLEDDAGDPDLESLALLDLGSLAG